MNNPVQRDIYYAVAHRDDEELASFKGRYEAFDAKAVIAPIFKEALGLDVASYRQSNTWGSSHVIYFVSFKDGHRDLVLRANLGVSSPEVEMLTEKLITDKVAALGVPTNTVLHADISRKTYPFDYQIQEILQGRDPEDDFEGSKEDYLRIAYETGEAIAKFSLITFEGFGRFDAKAVLQGELKGSKSRFSDYLGLNVDGDLEGLMKAELITEERAERIKSYLEERYPLVNNRGPASLVHHDLADHNLMYVDGHLAGVFDWEAAVAGDPILDLASAPTWKSHHPKREQLLAGYSSITPLPNNFEELERFYKLRTMLWKGYYATRINIMTDARRELLETTFKECGL